MFIGEYGISFVITRSRGAAVLDIHCPLFDIRVNQALYLENPPNTIFHTQSLVHTDIPIVVDGYAAYNKFKTKQRCWAHVLRDAELLAAMQGGNLVELHQKLQHMFHETKQLLPDTTDQQQQQQQQLQDNWIDPVMAIAGTYTELVTLVWWQTTQCGARPVYICQISGHATYQQQIQTITAVARHNSQKDSSDVSQCNRNGSLWYIDVMYDDVV